MLGVQKVPGSNPGAPTTFSHCDNVSCVVGSIHSDACRVVYWPLTGHFLPEFVPESNTAIDEFRRMNVAK